MRYRAWPKRDPIKNFFPVPNEIFDLGLPSGAISVYSYLLRCENRKTYQCWPSYRTIGKALQMSANTVRKYVLMLEERKLICTEPTKITTKDGRKRNGSLLYTIRPIQEAIDYFHQRQMEQLEESAELHRVAEKLVAFEQDKQLRVECPA
jgi:DNA-binding transcriptional regulator YhcF (GntR family)